MYSIFFFDKKYRIHIGPRESWQIEAKNPTSICYTDGSRKESTGLSGAGIYIEGSPRFKKSIALGKYTSVFQAEILAIMECAWE